MRRGDRSHPVLTKPMSQLLPGFRMLTVKQAHQLLSSHASVETQLGSSTPVPTACCGAALEVVALTGRDLADLLEVIVLWALARLNIAPPHDVYVYTSATVLHVRVVMKAIGSATCDRAAWEVDRGADAVMLAGHRIPLSQLAHIANRAGGPSHRSIVIRCSFREDRRQIVLDSCVTVFRGDV